MSKLISLVEKMVTLLNVEQGDDSKKAYCLKKVDETKALAKTIAGHRDDIVEFQDQLSNTDTWIEVVQKSTGELKSSVALSHSDQAEEARGARHSHCQERSRDRAARARRQQFEQIPRAQVAQGDAQGRARCRRPYQP